MGVPAGGSQPGGYYCQCNDTIDVIDENGEIICSLCCTVTPNANPANTQNSITFDGAPVVPSVSGVSDDFNAGPPYNWAYGCSTGTDLGAFNLSISGGLSSTGPSCGCTINSLTAPSVSGTITATPINPAADITHPSMLVFHCPDSNANPAAGEIGWQFNPGLPSTPSAFTFQYNLPTSPTISSFTPSNGDAGRTVKISGSYFSGATAVGFGGTSAASFTAQDGVTGTEVNSMLWYTISAAPLSAVSVAPSPAEPQLPGTAITLTATAIGGSNVQYQFWVYNPAPSPAWSELQAYSTQNTCTWTPTAVGVNLLSITALDGVTGTEVSLYKKTANGSLIQKTT